MTSFVRIAMKGIYLISPKVLVWESFQIYGLEPWSFLVFLAVHSFADVPTSAEF